MADSLSLSIASSLGSVTKNVELADADTARIVAWAQATLPALMVADRFGDLVPPATPASFEATMTAVAAYMVDFLITQELNWQRQQVAQQAAMAVAPVQVTPSA